MDPGGERSRVMKRIRSLGAIALVAAAALVAPGSAGAAQESPEVVEQIRVQFDVDQKGDGFIEYLLGAERRLDPVTGTVHHEEAWAYRVPCSGSPADIPRHCGTLRGGDAELIRFEMSGDTGEASLVLKHRGRISRVRFTSTESPTVFPNLVAHRCSRGVFTDFHYGEAEGRAMGQSVSREQTSDNEVAPTFIAESLCL